MRAGYLAALSAHRFDARVLLIDASTEGHDAHASSGAAAKPSRQEWNGRADGFAALSCQAHKLVLRSGYRRGKCLGDDLSPIARAVGHLIKPGIICDAGSAAQKGVEPAANGGVDEFATHVAKRHRRVNAAFDLGLNISLIALEASDCLGRIANALPADLARIDLGFDRSNLAVQRRDLLPQFSGLLRRDDCTRLYQAVLLACCPACLTCWRGPCPAGIALRRVNRPGLDKRTPARLRRRLAIAKAKQRADGGILLDLGRGFLGAWNRTSTIGLCAFTPRLHLLARQRGFVLPSHLTV